jgi:hypothetical protein
MTSQTTVPTSLNPITTDIASSGSRRDPALPLQALAAKTQNAVKPCFEQYYMEIEGEKYALTFARTLDNGSMISVSRDSEAWEALRETITKAVLEGPFKEKLQIESIGDHLRIQRDQQATVIRQATNSDKAAFAVFSGNPATQSQAPNSLLPLTKPTSSNFTSHPSAVHAPSISSIHTDTAINGVVPTFSDDRSVSSFAPRVMGLNENGFPRDRLYLDFRHQKDMPRYSYPSLADFRTKNGWIPENDSAGEMLQHYYMKLLFEGKAAAKNLREIELPLEISDVCLPDGQGLLTPRAALIHVRFAILCFLSKFPDFSVKLTVGENSPFLNEALQCGFRELITSNERTMQLELQRIMKMSITPGQEGSAILALKDLKAKVALLMDEASKFCSSFYLEGLSMIKQTIVGLENDPNFVLQVIDRL